MPTKLSFFLKAWKQVVLFILLLALVLVVIGRTAPNTHAVIVTVRDDFSSQAYNRQDGVGASWTTDWIETNDDGLADNGFIRIIPPPPATPTELLLQGFSANPVRAIERQFDLTDAVSAIWTFDWQCAGVTASDFVRIQISGDGGVNWTTIDTFTGDDPDFCPAVTSGSASYDIASLIDVNPTDSRIRFEYQFNAGTDRFEIDFVEVEYDVQTGPTPDEISGTVYRDYDNDGVLDTYEPGVPNIIVTAFLADGTIEATDTTDASGNYTLSVSDATAVRLEFTGIPPYLHPGPAGPDSATTVTFVTSPAADVNMGVHNPDQYCNDGADLATSCFVNGSAANFPGGPNDVLVRWDYTLRGQSTMPTHIAERDHLGSVWGLAYDRINEDLYTAAFLKRHSGLDSLGAIYASDPFTTTTNGALFVDVTSAPFNLDVGEIVSDTARGLTANPTAQSNDPTAFYAVGKVGLGDLAISEDYETLWFLNLFGKTLHSLDIAGPGNLQTYPVPTGQCSSYSTLYLNAGGPNFATLVDPAWNGDGYYVGGTAVASVGPAAPFNTNRSHPSAFGYVVPLPDGAYDVTLYAYETTGRTFDVTIETATQAITITANTPYSETRSVNVTDGMMDFSFTSTGGGDPVISGIEINPAGGQVFNETQPFALKIRDGDLYLGLVCSAEYSQVTADLEAYVFRLPAGSSSFQQVATFGLDYPKGDASDVTGCVGAVSAWHPWATAMPAICTTVYAGRTVWPQPVLSGIEFDVDGSLILTFMDRLGHQLGNGNYELVGTTLREGIIGGDILRLYNNNGVYELESNGAVGPLTAAWLTGDNGVGNGQGPGGGEFYQDDASPPRSHEETPVGGLAHWFGLGEVVATTMDPLGDPVSGGALFFNNVRGSSTTTASDTSFDGYEIYQSTGVSTFGKANGLGDLILICSPAPLEIGNRVWHDVDGDGIQEPGEQPLDGIQLNLYRMDGSLAGTAVTDASGQYLFNAANVTGDLQFNTDYVIRIDDLAPLITRTLTHLSPANTGNSWHDSDGHVTNILGLSNGERPEVQISTGRAGDNNHTYDFGFNNVPTAVTLQNIQAMVESTPILLALFIAVALALTGLGIALARRRQT